MFPKSLMKRITWLLLTFSLAVALAPAPTARAASSIRVSATGTTSWPCGDTWASACALQTAFAHATSGDEIWVGKGLYKPTTSMTGITVTFQLVSGVAVYGGFALTETLRTQRDPVTNIVVLSGDIDHNDVVDAHGVVTTAANIRGTNSFHVVTGANGATLDGVTITGGNAIGIYPNSLGGGMYNYGSSPTLSNITFSGNAAFYGGGMHNNSGSSPTLTNVTFSGNAAIGQNGGGMINGDQSNPTLTNVTFSGNSAIQYGGGMLNFESNPTLTNVTFSGNAATFGGGGMYNDSSSPQMRNTILWGDSGGEIYNDTSTPMINDSVVQGGCPSGSTCTRVIAADPLLAPLGSYGGSTSTRALLPGSAAIHATSVNCPATDQRGVTRGSTCDIGAFESQGFTLANLIGTPQSATINAVFAQPLGLSVTSAFSEPVAGGVISFTAPASGASLAEVTPFTKTISASGAVSATVTANGTAGSYTISAGTRGALSVNFALTNTKQILYVRPSGATSGICESWATSCELRYALNLALPGPNQEFWVAAGIYTPTATTTDRTATFQLVNGVAVYGGFGMTETLRTQRDPAANTVVLSGDIDRNDGVDARGVVTTSANLHGANSYHVVKGATDATLDGVIITGGNAQPDNPNNFGGGMYNYSTSPTLTNVIFSGNTATWGGGMGNADHSSPTLSNVTFSGNAATYSGGGMYNTWYSGPTLSNVTFSSNTAGINGGGMFNESSSNPTLTNVTFSGNTANNGGGMLNTQSSPTLTNVTFSGNAAVQGGGGVDNENSSSPTLTNVTFSGNAATYGGGMNNWTSCNPQLRNTLLWGDTGGEIYNAGTPMISDSVVQGGCPSDATCTNVIAANPLLGPLGTYGGSTPTIPLLPGSSAINATHANCPATDQRGVARGSTCDIGAFESQGFVLGALTGTPQIAIVNTAFAQPLGLRVTSAFSEPVAGGVISFTAHPAMNGASLAETTPFTKTISASGAVSATVTANALTGSYTVTASASGAISVHFALANKLTTTTTLTSAPNPSIYNQMVTFTATVTSSGGTPTGSVTFYDNGASLGSGVLSAGRQATLTTASLIAGTHPITATYDGDTNYRVSTASVYTQTVTQAPATITLGNLSQTYDGTTKPVTSTTLPAGLMLVITYTGISGTSYGPSTTAPTNAGTYQVEAAINDVNYQGTVTGTLIIHPANTTTSVTSAPNPATLGQAVTFTATVASSGGTPTGSITFTIDSTNLNVPLDENGQAVYVTQTLSLGNHPVSAAYSGDANYDVSSGVLSGGQTVNDAPITGLNAINSSPTRLTDVTFFTATVATGSNITYQWNFGDGQTASGAFSNHAYTTAGNYTAIVTATNGAGSVSTVTSVTITNQRPVANAGLDQNVPVNAVVTLIGSNSTDPDGHLPLMYRWTQSGGPNVTFTPNVSVTSFTAPSAPAVLTFTLNVTDAQGLPNLIEDPVIITVGDVAIANLTAANDSPMKIGHLTHFTATISAGSNVTFTWNFGDGHLASGATTSYTYPFTGTYTAIVTATNSLGSVSASTLVTIEPVRLYLPLVLK